MKKKQVLRIVGLLVAAGIAFALREMGLVGGGSATNEQESKQVDQPNRTGEQKSSNENKNTKASKSRNDSSDASDTTSNDRLEQAIDNEESGVMTEAKGVVVKVLPDDNEGDRHQRFIIKLPSGRTVLVAHNIDLAPRVPLEEMDIVEMYGQFEFNDRGGVMHWTHHDPGGRHEDGWIRHDGSIYQ